MSDKKEMIKAMSSALNVDANMQLNAVAFLEERLDAESPSTIQLASHLQHSTPKSRKRNRVGKWLLFAAAMIALMSQIIPAYKFITEFTWDNGITTSKNIPPIIAATPEGNLLLHGDPLRKSKAERMRALWESDLKNPAYFADYSLHYLAQNSTLPPDFLKIASQIDPDNAWFTCLAAGVFAKDCYKKVGDHPLAPPPEITYRRKIMPQWSISDPINAAAAMDLWRLSLTQPRFTSYQQELWKEKLAHSPDPKDQKSALASLMHLVAAPYEGLHFSKLSALLMTELQNADTSTPAGQQLFRDVDKHLTKYISPEPNSIIDGLVMIQALSGISGQIFLVETSSLDPELVERWKNRHAACKNYKEEKYLKNNEDNVTVKNIENHGSALAQLSLTPVSYKLPISIDDLAPMRYVEHCLILRFLSWFMMGLLLILLSILYADRFRQSSMLIKMGRIFAESIPLKTNLWFLICGCILPFAYYLLLYCFTPLGGKLLAFNGGGSWEPKIQFPATPYLFTLLLMIAIPMLLAQRITKNQSSVKLHPGYAILLAIIGWHLLTAYYTVAMILASPTLLWILWTIIQSIYSKNPSSILIRQVRTQLLITSTCSAIILFTIASIGFKLGECYWVRQDRLTNPPTDRLATTSYEAKTIPILHQAILKLLNTP